MFAAAKAPRSGAYAIPSNPSLHSPQNNQTQPHCAVNRGAPLLRFSMEISFSRMLWEYHRQPLLSASFTVAYAYRVHAFFDYGISITEGKKSRFFVFLPTQRPFAKTGYPTRALVILSNAPKSLMITTFIHPSQLSPLVFSNHSFYR